MMELLASYNEQVGALVLGNAPQITKYILLLLLRWQSKEEFY